MDIFLVILLSVLPVLVIVAALNDLTTMTIPNWISIGLIAGFAPAAFAVGMPLSDIVQHLGIGFCALVLGIALFAMRLLGGGDAKLMAAVCLWLGLSGSLVFVLATAVAGGLFSLGLILARSSPALEVVAGAGACPDWFGRLMQPKGDVPYGVAIALGALAAFPSSAIVQAFVGA